MVKPFRPSTPRLAAKDTLRWGAITVLVATSRVRTGERARIVLARASFRALSRAFRPACVSSAASSRGLVTVSAVTRRGVGVGGAELVRAGGGTAAVIRDGLKGRRPSSELSSSGSGSSVTLVKDSKRFTRSGVVGAVVRRA